MSAAAKLRLKILGGTIAARLGQNEARVDEAISLGKGREVMVQVMDSLRKMASTEQQLLVSRKAAVEKFGSFLGAGILAGLATLVAALGYWISASRDARRTAEQTNAELTAALAEKDVANEQIRQMQKTEAVAQLAGGIAHDFNNMLAVVISGINLAKRRLSKGDRGYEEMLDASLDGANRAASLVKRLLAFSRQQPLAPQSVDMNRLISGMSELLTRSLGEPIVLETVMGAGLWLTNVDPSQLENALLNLCVNARDAMPEGGKLTVETANCHLDDAYSKLHPGVPPGQYVLLAVTDSGTGMPPDVIAKAFDPFFTTKGVGKGTGLGLSQVFGFVKQTGGHTKIYSEVGVGTTVKIYLPRDYAKVATAAKSVENLPEVGGSETVLLVEDDPRVLTLTSASLKELGYTVIEANGPIEGLKVIESSAKIDLMLTDIVMPEINGRKLADAAMALRPLLKVVFMTGFTRNAVVHKGLIDPGVVLLTKPFTYAELATKIREALKTSDS